MSSSDGDYVADDSDHETSTHAQTAPQYGTRSSGVVSRPGAPSSSTRGGDTQVTKVKRAAWEDIQRSWDTIVESADGSINSAVEALGAASKRKRLLKDTTPLQRGIIRHLVLVLDLSFAMVEKDLRPTRYLLMLQYSTEFVTEFFEQNPISQLGIIGMRDGVAVRISEMGGNPTEHIEKLKGIREAEGQGNPSLQNALEMCRAALYHTPSHGTREVLVIYGALLSSDPGDVGETIQNLVKERIRVSVVGLAAHLYICAELCAKTNAGSQEHYHVALNEQHFRELFFLLTTPPVTRSKKQSESSLLMMGFPSRTVASTKMVMGMCACHSKLTRGGYLCPRCEAKVCSLPAECPSCGLTLILSTHLARSYHHLFPLRNWVEISWAKARESRECFGCLTTFPEWTREKEKREKEKSKVHINGKGQGTKEDEAVQAVVEGSGRYGCEVCGNHFCIDCDVFAHEVVHNCPGCQSDVRPQIEDHGRQLEDGDTVMAG